MMGKDILRKEFWELCVLSDFPSDPGPGQEQTKAAGGKEQSLPGKRDESLEFVLPGKREGGGGGGHQEV